MRKLSRHQVDRQLTRMAIKNMKPFVLERGRLTRGGTAPRLYVQNDGKGHTSMHYEHRLRVPARDIDALHAFIASIKTMNYSVTEHEGVYTHTFRARNA